MAYYYDLYMWYTGIQSSSVRIREVIDNELFTTIRVYSGFEVYSRFINITRNRENNF